MRAYYLNSKTDEHGPIEVEPSLNEYHRLIVEDIKRRMKECDIDLEELT